MNTTKLIESCLSQSQGERVRLEYLERLATGNVERSQQLFDELLKANRFERSLRGFALITAILVALFWILK